MSLQINKLNIATASIVNHVTVIRELMVSPAIGGVTAWNLDVSGSINVESYGTWTITPTATFTASVKMWGAGGNGRGTAYGGAGGFSSGSVTFEENVPYTMLVGQGGVSVYGNAGTRVLGGGAPGRKFSSTNPCGGGLSGIFSGSYSLSGAVIVAGGGGAGHTFGAVRGGAGGGLTGQSGDGGSTGGTQTSGGSPGTSSGTGEYGAAMLGGRGSSQAGSAGNCGAGGGYYGGGGGDGDGDSASGGSGYVHPTKVCNGITVSGDRATPANSSDPSRGSAGSSTDNGANAPAGRVIIS